MIETKPIGARVLGVWVTCVNCGVGGVILSKRAQDTQTWRGDTKVFCGACITHLQRRPL